MNDDQPEDGYATATPIRLIAPRSNQIFTGNASGTYSPINPPPPSPGATIKCYFWKNIVLGQQPTGPADFDADASMDDPSLGTWKATFNLGSTGPLSAGFLRAEKTDADGGGPWSSEAEGLTYSSAFLLDKQGARRTKAPRALRTAHIPSVLIQEPSSDTEVVPRFFMVHGRYNSGDDNTVSVKLFREDGTLAVATILPTEYPGDVEWATAIIAYEGGIGYSVEATLIDKNGHPVRPAHSVAVVIA